MTTLIGQATLSAFSAFSLLKGNIRLLVILGAGQALLLVGTFLYIRRQSRFSPLPPREATGEASYEASLGPAKAPDPPRAAPPYAYGLVRVSILTIVVVFVLTIVFASFTYSRLHAPWQSPAPPQEHRRAYSAARGGVGCSEGSPMSEGILIVLGAFVNKHGGGA